MLRLFKVCVFVILGSLASCGENAPLPAAEDCIVRMDIDWMDVPINLTSSKLDYVLDQVNYQLYQLVKQGVSSSMQGSRGELVYYQFPKMCDQKIIILETAINGSKINESGDFFVSVSNSSFTPSINTISVTGSAWQSNNGQ